VNFSRVFIIAEAGVNHNGDPKLARQMIAAAAAAGADAVKFQSFRAEQVASPQAAQADYQRRSGAPGNSQLELLRGLELSWDAHRELVQYAGEHRIVFFSSPFDCASADLLEQIGVPLFKLGSGEITHIPLLRHVARKHKPVLLSTGMATLEEVGHAVRVLQEEGSADIVLMHCVTQYPAPAGEINLRAMQTMASALRLPAGYSDHSQGHEIAWAAVALGACAIEKHFTLSRALPGPDHAASLEPQEFKVMVQGIRRIESALGDGVKRAAPCELANRQLVRRSVFAAEEILAGQRVTAAALACKRPGTGIPAERFDELLGRRAARRLEAGEMLSWDDVRPDSHA
jgi:N-acetylneuraminate synthase/N,N'-diacetyllegionaminate synthase